MVNRARRRFLLSGAAAVLAPACATKTEKPVTPARRYHVAIVGGGYGGASVARFLKTHAPEIEVTLVEYDKVHATGPASNWVIGGLKPFPSILARYRALDRLGVKLIHDWVTAIDVEGRNLRFDDGSRLGYDRLIIAPGVAMDWKALPGYDEKVAQQLPHGWIPGLETLTLAQQLKRLRRGGTVLLARAAGDLSCPQAFYERASLMAHYLREHNPTARLRLFDPSKRDELRGHFEAAWREQFRLGETNGVIELVTGNDARVQRVDPVARKIYAGAIEERHRADLLDVIPPQRAGRLAQAADLVDNSGWCPVDPVSGESKRAAGIYVIGDAAASPFGRSAIAAHQAAARCARHIVALTRNKNPETLEQMPVDDAVFSLITPDLGLLRHRLWSLGAEGPKLIDGKTRIETGKREAEAAKQHYKQLRKVIWS